MALVFRHWPSHLEVQRFPHIIHQTSPSYAFIVGLWRSMVLELALGHDVEICRVLTRFEQSTLKRSQNSVPVLVIESLSTLSELYLFIFPLSILIFSILFIFCASSFRFELPFPSLPLVPAFPEESEALIFAGDFNEDESGPVVRSLSLKPGDTVAALAKWFLFHIISEYLIILFHIWFFCPHFLFCNIALIDAFPNLTTQGGSWTRWTCWSWSSPCRYLWSKDRTFSLSTTDFWSSANFWQNKAASDRFPVLGRKTRTTNALFCRMSLHRFYIFFWRCVLPRCSSRRFSFWFSCCLRFYTDKTLSPVAVRAPFTPEQEEATLERSIPAEWHFSDHVPIGGIFQLSGTQSQSHLKEAIPIV